MKLIKYIFCAILFIGVASADTINIDWMDGNTTYAQTTCTVGGDLILPATPTRRGYTFAGWNYTVKVYLDGVELPIEYDRLEYIESTGIQWIDTQTKGGTWEVLAQNTNLSSIQSQILFGNGIAANTWAGYTPAYGIYDFGIQSDLVHEKYLYTGQNKIINGSVLFSGNTGSLYHYLGRVFYLKIRKEGVLVRNLIPVRNLLNKQIGMYDTVENQFYGNGGTGEFVSGPIVYE